MAGYAATARKESSAVPWMAMGSLLFGGAMMIIVGFFQLFQGLLAILSNAFYVVSPDYAYRFNLAVWGIFHLLVGLLLVAAGVYLFSGKLWARLTAIALAAVSACTNFLFIPYYPLWSIVIIALDILVIWAVASYGRELAD